MPIRRKLQGGPWELTKLKRLWPLLKESDRNHWRARFDSKDTQQKIRAEIAGKFAINLTSDCSISNFRKWLADQDDRQVEKEKMAEDERSLTDEYGKSMSMDEIRESVLRRSYARTMARGDFLLGLRTLTVDQRERALQFYWKMKQFDAATECYKRLPEFKLIASDPKLTDREKIDLIRRKLFGELPEDAEKEKQNEEKTN